MLQFYRTLLAGVMLSACLGCSTVSMNPPRSITVLTYNIHHGEGADGKLDLERIARVINAEEPDLVALQEVDQKATRTGNIDQAAEIARMTKMNFVYGKAMDFQGGGYGQAILSRWPIKNHQVLQLPQRPGREPRILLTATIDGPILGLIFAGTHLDHEMEEVRIQQTRAISDHFANKHEAAILVGDFNARPSAESLSTILSHWKDTAGPNAAATIPAKKPFSRIDYIFVQPTNRWQVLDSRVLPEAIASDHRPVLSILRFLP